MATTERRGTASGRGGERLTVAPIVGPDDERRFTDSGIEIAELYTHADLPDPLDQVSTSMTINTPAACLLLIYELVGEEQSVPSEKLRGTTQNDVLKEYIARGNYIYPPGPTMRLTTDLFSYCHEHVPRWNTISISA